jgi:Response regulator containing a CheY-like receiver domain and an HTH DNA-binding domain
MFHVEKFRTDKAEESGGGPSARENVVNMLTELVESMEVVCAQNVFAQLSAQEVQEAVTSWYELAYTSLQGVQELLRRLPSYRGSAVPSSLAAGVADRAVPQVVLRSASDKKIAASALGMTAREYELTLLLARSMSLKDIARQWGVCEKTVRNHLTNVSRKLHCQDRVQIVLYALRAGWIELS